MYGLPEISMFILKIEYRILRQLPGVCILGCNLYFWVRRRLGWLRIWLPLIFNAKFSCLVYFPYPQGNQIDTILKVRVILSQLCHSVLLHFSIDYILWKQLKATHWVWFFSFLMGRVALSQHRCDWVILMGANFVNILRWFLNLRKFRNMQTWRGKILCFFTNLNFSISINYWCKQQITKVVVLWFYHQ